MGRGGAPGQFGREWGRVACGNKLGFAQFRCRRCAGDDIFGANLGYPPRRRRGIALDLTGRETKMTFSFQSAAAGLGLLAAIGGGVVHADESRVTPPARWLAHELDSMGVETKWIAGVHIDWKTGLPDGASEKLPGHHTHCSAFVAAVTERLGIYILRPPQHGQVLLANAQNKWLPPRGRAGGRRPP